MSVNCVGYEIVRRVAQIRLLLPRRDHQDWGGNSEIGAAAIERMKKRPLLAQEPPRTPRNLVKEARKLFVRLTRHRVGRQGNVPASSLDEAVPPGLLGAGTNGHL